MESALAGATPGRDGLTGRLEEFSPFDLIQVLLFLRRSGDLELLRIDGPHARCRLSQGHVVAARCGHLEGTEALLTLLWWHSGEFRFQAVHAANADPGAAPLGTEALMMDAVRLADEIELRSQQLPGAALPLRLAPDARLPEDPFGCGVESVFEYLAIHPGATRSALEETLPLSPIKVRLALIVLHPLWAAAPIGVPQRAAATGAASVWWNEIYRRHPGGLRVLVAFAVSSAFGDIDRAVQDLGQALGAPMTSSAVSALGPSFVRFRPPQGGVLSITFLPITAKHRYLLETFAGSVAAVLLGGWTAAGAEAEVWTSMVPQSVDFEVLDETRNLGDELSAALRRVAQERG